MHHLTIKGLCNILSNSSKPINTVEGLFNALFAAITYIDDGEADDFIKSCLFLHVKFKYAVRLNTTAYTILTKLMSERHTHEQYMQYLTPYGFAYTLPRWMNINAIDFTKLTLKQSILIRGCNRDSDVPLFSDVESEKLRAILKAGSISAAQEDLSPEVDLNTVAAICIFLNTFTAEDAQYTHKFPKHHNISINDIIDKRLKCINPIEVYPLEELLKHNGKIITYEKYNGAIHFKKDAFNIYNYDSLCITDETVPYIVRLFDTPYWSNAPLPNDLCRTLMKHKLNKTYKDQNCVALFKRFGINFLRNNAFTVEQIEEMRNACSFSKDDWSAITSNPKCSTAVKTYAKLQTYV